MRRIITTLTAGVLCFFLTGCPMVGSKEIVGDKVAKISPEKWDGHWVSGDSIIQVKVKDKDKGILEIYYFQGKKKQGPYSVYLREVKGYFVASMKDRKKGYYLWTVVGIYGDFGQLMLLNMKRFSELVESGELPGKVIKSVPVLGNMTEEQHVGIVKKAANDFDYRQGVTFVRLEGFDRIREKAVKQMKEAKPVNP